MTGEMGHMLHTHHTVLKNQLKNGLKPWRLRPETVKLLEDIGCKLLDTGFGNDFFFFGFDIKSKNKQVGLHQNKRASSQQGKQSTVRDSKRDTDV